MEKNKLKQNNAITNQKKKKKKLHERKAKMKEQKA